MSDPLIKVDNIEAGYIPGVNILQGCSLDLAPGEYQQDYLVEVVSEPYKGVAFAYVDWDDTHAEVDETNNMSQAETWCSYSSYGDCEDP